MNICLSAFLSILALGPTTNDTSISLYRDYDQISHYSCGLARVMKDSLYGFIDTGMNEVIPYKFEGLHSFNSSSKLAAFKDSSELWGFFNTHGDTQVQPQYTNLWYYDDQSGLCYAEKGNHYGFIDKNGHEVIPFIYDKTHSTPESVHEGFIRMRKNGKYGFINEKGQEIIPFIFDFIDHSWANQKAFKGIAANIDSTSYLIDLKKGTYVRTSYNFCENESDGMVLIKKGELYGYLDNRFLEVIAPRFTNARSFADGRAPVQINGAWGYIDKKGELITELKYDKAMGFYNKRARVTIGEKTGYIDRRGREAIAVEYADTLGWWWFDGNFHYNYIPVSKDGMLNLLDPNGRAVSNKKYREFTFADMAQLYTYKYFDKKGNYALGERDNLFYALDKKGREINQIGSRRMIFFMEGLAFIANADGTCGFINRRGKVVIPLEFENFEYCHFSNGESILKKNGKFGMIDKKGKIIIPFEYNWLGHFSDGRAIAEQNGRFVVLNENGEILLVGNNVD